MVTSIIDTTQKNHAPIRTADTWLNKLIPEVERYDALGWHLVKCAFNSKRPIGTDWGNNPVPPHSFDGNVWNVGIILGERSNVIDIETDGKDAEQDFAKLFEGIDCPVTPTYQSARGKHRLFQFNPKLPQVAVCHYGELEIRTGNGRAAHSLLPPSVTEAAEGVYVSRQWLVSPDECDVAPLPDRVLQRLLEALEQDERQRRSESEYKANTDPNTPGNQFNAKVFADLNLWGKLLLEPAGWRHAYSNKQGDHYERPGKHTSGKTGGTVYYDNGFFRCFTSSAPPLIQDKTYSPFSALAELQYGGDRRKAASALSEFEASSVFDWFRPDTDDTDGVERASIFQPISHWRTLPKQRWLIKGWLTERETMVLYGRTGECKSFVALDWSLSLTTGTTWAGNPVRQCDVAYIYTEALQGGIKRVDAWLTDRGIEKDPPLFLSQTPVPLNDLRAHDRIVEELRLAKMTPNLLVIDTLAKNFSGDENNTPDMNKLTATVEQLRQTLKCAIVVVHHVGKDDSKGERGSNALRSNLDSSVKVRANRGCVIVTAEKCKDETTNRVAGFNKRVIKLRTEVDEWCGEYDVTSLVLDYDTNITSLKDVHDKCVAKKLSADLDEVLDGLKHSEGMTIDDLATKCSMTKTTMRRHLKTLLAEGLIDRIENSGNKPNLYFSKTIKVT